MTDDVLIGVDPHPWDHEFGSSDLNSASDPAASFWDRQSS